jgi:hypothetical protein
MYNVRIRLAPCGPVRVHRSVSQSKTENVGDLRVGDHREAPDVDFRALSGLGLRRDAMSNASIDAENGVQISRPVPRCGASTSWSARGSNQAAKVTQARVQGANAFGWMEDSALETGSLTDKENNGAAQQTSRPRAARCPDR